MTRLQIENAERPLRGLTRLTKEQKILQEELFCRSMINSCLTYGSIKNFWEKHPWSWDTKSYADPYIKALGLRRVTELVAEQEADFAKAIVKKNTYTDGEGMIYHTVIWANEQEAKA